MQVWILAVSLSKSLNLSKSPFPNLQTGPNNTCLVGLNEIMCVKGLAQWLKRSKHSVNGSSEPLQAMSNPLWEALGAEREQNCAPSAGKLRGPRKMKPFPPRRGNWVQFESWDCNHLLRTKRPITSTSSSLLPLYILRPFSPAFFVLFPCLWGCRKAAAFLRLLFKDILRDAATAAPRATAAAAPVPATASGESQHLLSV